MPSWQSGQRLEVFADDSRLWGRNRRTFIDVMDLEGRPTQLRELFGGDAAAPA